MDLFALIFPPYRMLLPGTENRSSHFRSRSLNITNQPTFNFLNGAGGGYRTNFPCLEDINRPPGYEDITFEPKTLMPPAYSEPEVYSTRQSVKSFAFVREEDAREAIIRYASEKCCHHTHAIKYMKITEISMHSTFHYTLETFTEKREVVWCYDQYAGEAIDSVKNGIPRGPWDIMQTPTEQFENAMWQTEIPYTASVQDCCACDGTGKEKCSTCHGTTRVDCAWCNGYGRSNSYACTRCDGNGKERCTECNWAGQIQCATCVGKRKLKFYLKLITTWTNHKDEFVSQQTPLPAELIHNEAEKVAFHEERSRVRPLDHFPQHGVKEASRRLISEHTKAFPMERVLQQRHEVRIIPVAQVKYTWKDKSGECFVYGFGNKVYFPEYPEPCCCNCIVM